MLLSVSSTEARAGVFAVTPVGSINSETYGILESEIESILGTLPRAVVLDMKSVGYMSSAGLRIIQKTKKALKKNEGDFIVVNLQPQIRKVFEIVNALPSLTVFSSNEEMDQYLDTMQRRIVEGEE